MNVSSESGQILATTRKFADSVAAKNVTWGSLLDTHGATADLGSRLSAKLLLWWRYIFFFMRSCLHELSSLRGGGTLLFSGWLFRHYGDPLRYQLRWLWSFWLLPGYLQIRTWRSRFAGTIQPRAMQATVSERTRGQKLLQFFAEQECSKCRSLCRNCRGSVSRGTQRWSWGLAENRMAQKQNESEHQRGSSIPNSPILAS